VNYQKNWQCAAVLKADQNINSDSALTPTTASVVQNTKFTKRGNISHPSQVPWH
jgi:hypothetical protein